MCDLAPKRKYKLSPFSLNGTSYLDLSESKYFMEAIQCCDNTYIRQPMLQLATQYGFHEMFLSEVLFSIEYTKKKCLGIPFILIYTH